MSFPIISVEELSKRYVIGHQDPNDGLRHILNDAIRNPFKWIANRASRLRERREEFWAVKNVSFEIAQGEIVGIIGRNGAGKSTLLKMLSRITEPTLGRIRLRGRIASLLEVGTGFHPDLTGRENVFLNGAILGMSRAEIRSKFDEIVAFSEVEKYLDTPVKRYSSGMYVRLAFAVAAHMEPEILIVDEVLAVGDAAFQKKCLGKMDDVAKSKGRTVLFVSHSMGTISRLCGRTMLLENGKLAMIDSTEAVVSRYVLSGGQIGTEREWSEHERPKDNKIRLRAVRVTDLQGSSIGSADVRKPVCVEVHYDVLRPVSHVRVGMRLTTADGTVVFSSADTLNSQWREKVRTVGRHISRCVIPGNLLNEGVYVVTVGGDSPGVEPFFFEENAVHFHIEQTGGPGSHDPDKWPGVVCPQLTWEIASFSSGTKYSTVFSMGSP